MILARIIFALVMVWFIVGAWLTSDGGTSITDLIGLELGAIILGLGWLAAFILAVRKWGSLGKALTPSIIAILTLLVVGFGLQWFEAAFPVRFALSESSLERYAETVSPANRDSRTSRRVGLFSVKETETLDNEVVRLITAQCMFDECGLVYSPNGVPPRIGEDTYVRIKDDWFYWERSW